MMWIIHLLELLTIFTSGSLKLYSYSPAIVHGKNAWIGEIPYQVSLQDYSTSVHFCGGSILNEKYVITAAHCVQDKSPRSIKVIAGSIDLKDHKTQVTNLVQEIILHKKYNAQNSWINDIALLKMVYKFKTSDTIGFVSLLPKDFVVKADDVATVSGWGRLWQDGPTTEKLQRVDIVIADQNYCSSIYRMRGYNIYATQICAYNRKTEKGSCHGDSGGPLTIRGKLVGLVSWANGCASTFYPTVYTRVSSYLDWIKANTV